MEELYRQWVAASLWAFGGLQHPIGEAISSSVRLTAGLCQLSGGAPPRGSVIANVLGRFCSSDFTRIPQMDCQFDDLLERFCYKNQCNTIIAAGQIRLTRRMNPESLT